MICGTHEYNFGWLDPIIGWACQWHDRCYDEKLDFLFCNLTFGVLVGIAAFFIFGSIAFLLTQKIGKKYYDR
jgi:hypothetical protein